MPTPKWLTGRTRTPVYTLDFTLEAQWAPMVDTRVHYVRYGELRATVDGAYLVSPIPTIAGGARGPYVTITPQVRKVTGSETFGASPYKPDSPEGYTWQPSGDPAGGWVEVTNWPLHRVQFGYNLIIFGGDGYASSVNVFIPVGGDVVAWAPGAGATPGPMGGISYSSFGVPSGVTIPTGRGSWTAPDDWERTGGTTYSGGISGTITFNGGLHEEFFTNLDLPTATASGFTPSVPAAHISEIGTRDPANPGPPWARQYAEQRKSGSTQSITVSLTVDGGTSYSTYNLTTPANGSFNNANFFTPFAEVSAFTHTLGSGGSATSASYSLSASFNIGGVSISPVSVSHSDTGGSASASGGTANSNTEPGSPAWPAFGTALPGGGQRYRGGIKIGSAATYLKLPIPREVVFAGQIKRLPDVGNDIPYDLLVEAYNPSAGTTLTVLDTISGVTSSFSRTYRYDDRASQGTTRLPGGGGGVLAGTIVNGSGGSAWQTLLPSTYPTNAGLRLGGSNASSVATRRLCIRGKRWILYRAFAPDMVAIAPDSGAAWPTRTDGPGMTTSIVSGKLRLVSTAAAFTRLATSTKVPEYRMHKIRIRSVGSASQSLRIRRVGSLGSPAQHSFDWTISTGADGSWVEVDLDPLASYSGPCHSITPGIVTQNSNYWQFDTAGAVTIEIEWFRALRRTFATLDCVRRRLDIDPAAMVGTLDGTPYTLALRPSDEIEGSFGGWDFQLEATPSASKPWGYDWPYNKIIDLAGPFPQADWYDADNYDYVGGAGLMCDEGDETWVTYLDEGATQPGEDPLSPAFPPPLLPAHAVPAQELLERVILYPGAGDVFGVVDGSYGITTTLRFGLLLGAAVSGQELGEIEDGADWPDIVALDGSTERARAVVAGDEHYGLLTPDLRNGVSYSVRLDPEDDTAQRLTISGADKQIFRTLWLLATLRMLSMAVSATQRICRGFRAPGGVLGLEFRRVGSPDTWESSTTSLSIPRGGCLTYDAASASQRLWIAYETSGGGIEARYTDDEGGTWSVATTITSTGRCPAACASPTQVRYFAWVVSGAVKVKGLDSLDNAVLPETTAVASGAANTGLAIVHDGELLHLTYQASGGAQTSVKSADGGLTWA